MAEKHEVKSIQATAYNGARTEQKFFGQNSKTQGTPKSSTQMLESHFLPVWQTDANVALVRTTKWSLNIFEVKLTLYLLALGGTGLQDILKLI